MNGKQREVTDDGALRDSQGFQQIGQFPAEALLKGGWGQGRTEGAGQIQKGWTSGPLPICPNHQLRGLLPNEIEWGRLETQHSTGYNEKERRDSVLKT